MIGLPSGEETMTIMLSRFDRIPERDRQTDRQLVIDIDITSCSAITERPRNASCH